MIKIYGFYQLIIKGFYFMKQFYHCSYRVPILRHPVLLLRHPFIIDRLPSNHSRKRHTNRQQSSAPIYAKQVFSGTKFVKKEGKIPFVQRRLKYYGFGREALWDTGRLGI